MTEPPPELIAQMHDAIVLRGRLPLVEQRAKRAARVTQDALDTQAAKYADLIEEMWEHLGYYAQTLWAESVADPGSSAVLLAQIVTDDERLAAALAALKETP